MGRVMRVGFVVGEFPLLSETFVADQMAGLLARGFDVEVVCDRTKGDDRIEPAKRADGDAARQNSTLRAMGHGTQQICTAAAAAPAIQGFDRS